MLYELGPLDLFLEREFPTPGARGSIEAAAAPFVVALEAGAGAVEQAGGQFAAVAVGVDDGGAALDLGDAASELARQSGDVSPEIASAVAGAGVLEGDLAGLASELLGDLASGDPPSPPVPPDGYPGGPPPDPEGGGQPPPPPPVEYDHSLDDLAVNACFGPACVARYRVALAGQVERWTGRAATEHELRACQDFQDHYGFLSDLALDWMWTNWVYPNLPETTGG